jgi:RNA polymerase sigma-70 factor (ECF subfamily)
MVSPSVSGVDLDRRRRYRARRRAAFDAIRAMIANDVRLDLVNKPHSNGNAEVFCYFRKTLRATWTVPKS